MAEHLTTEVTKMSAEIRNEIRNVSETCLNVFSSSKERLDALTRDELIEDIRELEEALDTLWFSRQRYIDQVTEAYDASANDPLERQADLVGNTFCRTNRSKP